MDFGEGEQNSPINRVVTAIDTTMVILMIFIVILINLFYFSKKHIIYINIILTINLSVKNSDR